MVNYADKLLSALRYKSGDHKDQAAAKKGGS